VLQVKAWHINLLVENINTNTQKLVGLG